MVFKQNFIVLAVAVCLLPALRAAEPRPFAGTVLSADEAARTLTVLPRKASDGAAPLTVKVSPGDAAIGYVERPVEGQLVHYGGQPRLQRIWPADPLAREHARQAAEALHRETLERGFRAVRQRGAYLPDFALWDQHGKLVTTDDLRGDYLVLNFIFTRCTVPTFCPAATSRMIRLQREAEEAGVENLRLITITFDPEYDTPGILRYYADTRGIDNDWHTFLTGDPQAIRDLMKQFGILTKEEDNTITHTMNTLLVDPRGKIVYNGHGSRWSTLDFLKRMQAHQAL